MLDRQTTQHRAERDEQTQRVEAADRHAAEVRAEVAVPLIEQATTEGTSYLAARERAIEADRAKATAGRLRRRAATRTATEANAAERDAEARLRGRWTHLPQSTRALPEWAEAVAVGQADTDPRVAEASHEAAEAHRDRQQLAERHRAETGALYGRVLAQTTPAALARAAAKLRRQVEHDRADLAQLQALPIPEAAQLARQRAAQAEAARAAAEQAQAAMGARAARLGRSTAQAGQERIAPQKDFGPNL